MSMSPMASGKRSWNSCIRSDSSNSLQDCCKESTLPTPSSSSSPVIALRHAANQLLLPAARLVQATAGLSSPRKNNGLSIHVTDNITSEEDAAHISTDSGLDDYEAADGGALSSPSATSRSSAEIDETEENLSTGGGSGAMEQCQCRKCGVCLRHGVISSSTTSRTSQSSQHRGSGTKYKLIHEGEVAVCRLNHARTLISKLLSSKYLRRWETHRLILADDRIYSKQLNGFMEHSVPYAQIEEIHEVSRWDEGGRYCIRIVVPDGSVLLQVPNTYAREQWCHSLHWKRSFFKYRKMLLNSRRPEVMIKEIKNMIELVSTTPLQDEVIYQTPLDIISELLQLQMISNRLDIPLSQEIIVAIAPLLENSHPTVEISEFFSRFCKECPRSGILMDHMTPIVRRILKHNMDFGNNPRMRIFIQDYFLALNSHNDGSQAVKDFIRNMHGAASCCPHPRVLPNLVSVSVAAVQSLFDDQSLTYENKNEVFRSSEELDDKLACFVSIFQEMSTFDDWRTPLAQLLHPVPFPAEAISNRRFSENFAKVIRNIGADPRCEVHSCVLGVRDNKDGWLHLFAPGGPAVNDFAQSEGLLFTDIMDRLVQCCGGRKTFLTSQLDRIRAPCLLMALRESASCQDILCWVLELDVEKDRDYQLQIISTLQSTTSGKHKYAGLCERQIALRELQQKGGPRKLTLPSKSTDADLAKLLSSGSFGNLECLSLAFTQVTNACAEYLIKLPSLKYLNLWSTQFSDAGLILVTEHLHRLQVLNLCETPMTDRGLVHLCDLKHLKKLNLNSTRLSGRIFETLKESLPALTECDIRYTDAW